MGSGTLTGYAVPARRGRGSGLGGGRGPLPLIHVRSLLADHPVLLLFVILAMGTAVGQFRVRGISIGPAAVLFAALAFSAWQADLALPDVVGTLGLALFAYCIGLVAGPSFFSSLKSGAGPVTMVAGTLVGLGALTWAVGRLLGFGAGTVAGLYAGATTNTPALAAAIEHLGGSPEPTVAYSLSYALGVVILLGAAAWTLKRPGVVVDDAEGPEPIVNATIKVENENVLTVSELTWTPYGRVLFSRHQRGDDGEVDMSHGDTVLKPGERVLAIGPERALEHVIKQLGRRSTLRLDEERHDVDFRRMVLSEKRFFGRTVAEVNLWGNFEARATRVRRADHDFLATDGFVLQAGDRIRVAAPREQMGAVARYLGDSEHGTADINPLGLASGLALGLLIGFMPILVPGLGEMTLGSAAGPLLVGLVLGRVQRTGRIVWSLPHQAAEVLTQLGLLLFLAYAGGRAGAAFVEALQTPLGLKIIGAGVVVSGVHALALLVIARHYLGVGGPRLAGFMAGSQTQPAVLAFANSQTDFDQRVALGYALVYPVAMVTKILVAQVLTLVT